MVANGLLKTILSEASLAGARVNRHPDSVEAIRCAEKERATHSGRPIRVWRVC
jgi:hypothetical protein